MKQKILTEGDGELFIINVDHISQLKACVNLNNHLISHFESRKSFSLSQNLTIQEHQYDVAAFYCLHLYWLAFVLRKCHLVVVRIETLWASTMSFSSPVQSCSQIFCILTLYRILNHKMSYIVPDLCQLCKLKQMVSPGLGFNLSRLESQDAFFCFGQNTTLGEISRFDAFHWPPTLGQNCHQYSNGFQNLISSFKTWCQFQIYSK